MIEEIYENDKKVLLSRKSNISDINIDSVPNHFNQGSGKFVIQLNLEKKDVLKNTLFLNQHYNKDDKVEKLHMAITTDQKMQEILENEFDKEEVAFIEDHIKFLGTRKDIFTLKGKAKELDQTYVFKAEEMDLETNDPLIKSWSLQKKYGHSTYHKIHLAKRKNYIKDNKFKRIKKILDKYKK